LTHTGGTGDIFGPQFEANRQNMRDLKDYVKLYGSEVSSSSPARSGLTAIMYSYCWESWSKRFPDRVITTTFATTSSNQPAWAPPIRFPEGTPVSSGSVGYIRADGGALRPNTATLPPRGTSAGGGYSTVEDLLRFSNALLGRKLLNAEYTELVTTATMSRTASAGSATAVELLE